VLEAIVARLPAPTGHAGEPLKALLIDSWYDSYLGVVVLVRVRDGVLKPGMKIRLVSTGARLPGRPASATSRPSRRPPTCSSPARSLPDRRHQGRRRHQDRRHHHRGAAPLRHPLPGFKPSVPVVFCGLFPIDAAEYQQLRESLAKLRLNDASFHFEPETSAALGFGFRCGFLGLLHLEIIQERLEREFNLDLITTAPSVVYRVHLTNAEMKELHNPRTCRRRRASTTSDEPWIKAHHHRPRRIYRLDPEACEERRGVQQELNYVGTRACSSTSCRSTRWSTTSTPAEIVSRGYAASTITSKATRPATLKLSILVNGEPVDASPSSSTAPRRGPRRHLCERLKELIPRQLFKIAIQAAIGARVIAARP